MYIDIGNLSIYIGFPFAVFFALSANLYGDGVFLTAFFTAVMHEAIHLIFLFLCGCKNASLEFYPGGIKIKAAGFSLLSYKKTALVSLSAPAVNIFAGAVFFIAGRLLGTEQFFKVSAVNLILGIINLFPLSFLDGGRALKSLLSVYFSAQKVEKFCDFFSVGALLLMTAVFFTLLIRGNMSLNAAVFYIYCLSGTLHDKRDGGIT